MLRLIILDEEREAFVNLSGAERIKWKEGEVKTRFQNGEKG